MIGNRNRRNGIFRVAEIAAKASLATATHSCILPLHLTRWLKKLPANETA
jgi:hypothetical protein